MDLDQVNIFQPNIDFHAHFDDAILPILTTLEVKGTFKLLVRVIFQKMFISWWKLVYGFTE